MLLLAGAARAQFGTVAREQKIASNSGNFSGVLGNDYRFGVSVADIGDFDHDGVRDLVVGGHRANIGGMERGAIWILCMNPNGSVKTHTEISSLAGGLVGPLDDGDRFGISVCSLGDLDLDGTTDLAVGTYRDDDGGTDFGAVYILFLRPDGTVKREQKISALAGGFVGALKVEDSFGWSVENIGDLDDDGVIDLAVGATRDDGNDPDPVADFGAVYILFMNADGTVKADTRIGQGTNGLGNVLRPSDRFGGDIVLLDDADGDGVEDLAVGAFGDDPLKTGKVFVLHMHTDGTIKSLQEIGAGTGGFTGVLGHGDRFGISLAAHDLDGDGLKDLFVGAIGDDDGGADAGAVWVCLLDALGRVRKTEKISPDFGGFGGLLHPGDNFGVSCTTIGDLDRDGAVDLAVGSYQDDEGGFDRGAVWILFRAGTGVPVADFVSTPGSGQAPLAVQFSDRSTGTITSWHWDFGDGSLASTPSPAHTYATPGVYDVRLTVGGLTGSDSLLRQRAVVAQPPLTPDADFSVAPTSGPVPLTAIFSDLSTGSITSWSWDFGDGSGSITRNSKHSYVLPGTYTVSLTVAGPLGTSNRTVIDLVTASEPPPVANFSADPTSGVAPLAVAFTDLSTPDVTSWSWDFGDGSSASQQNPVHTYTSGGTFDVRLAVQGPGGSDVLLRPALVRLAWPLTAAFDVLNPGGVAPVTVQFTDRSLGNPTSWQWDFGDGGTSSLQSPAHTYHGGGTLPVQLIVTDGTSSASVTIPVDIGEPRPDARFTVSTLGGDTPLEVFFTDKSVGNITAWLWDFGDGHGSTVQDPRHVYIWPGVYTVRLRVWSAGGVDGTVRKDLIQVTGSALRLGGALPAAGPLRTILRLLPF